MAPLHGAPKSLAEAYDLLLAYPTLGPFLAFQYAVDFNYTTLMNHSERDFVVAGPGALDGLSKCFESLGDYSPEDTIAWLSDMQVEEFSRYKGFSMNYLSVFPLCCLNNVREETACCYCLSAWNQTVT